VLTNPVDYPTIAFINFTPKEIKMVNAYEHAGCIMHRCSQSVKELLGKESYLFIPSKSNRPRALAVAHCDTVFDEDSAYSAYNYRKPLLKPMIVEDTSPRRHGANRIVSGNLDDRLGVAIILDILPKIMPEFAYDILLTDDEEIGRTTAADFVRNVEDGYTFFTADGDELDMDDRVNSYQFIFEFDRAGTDVVTYQYYNTVAENLLEDAGWRIGRGSFSDISEMDALGLWAANFGCGYHYQHSTECYVDLRELDINLRRFMYFVDLLGNKTLLDFPKPKPKYNGYNGYNSSYQGSYQSSTVARTTVPAGAFYEDDDDDYDSPIITGRNPSKGTTDKYTIGSPKLPLVDARTNRLVDSDDMYDDDLEKLANEMLNESDAFVVDDPSSTANDTRWDAGIEIEEDAWIGLETVANPLLDGYSDDDEDTIVIADPKELDSDGMERR